MNRAGPTRGHILAQGGIGRALKKRVAKVFERSLRPEMLRGDDQGNGMNWLTPGVGMALTGFGVVAGSAILDGVFRDPAGESSEPHASPIFRTLMKECRTSLPILGLLVLSWSRFIAREKAPFATIIPGYWGNCEDVSLLNNAGYLSGKHALEGFSFWSFHEGLGENLFFNLIVRPLNPLNALGAFLVDRYQMSVHKVFGWINLLYAWVAEIGLYKFLRIARGWSSSQAAFGIFLHLFLPYTYYYMHFTNYSTIISAFPWLLSASNAFARGRPHSGFVLACIISLPLYFGMVNVYANYFLLAIFSILYDRYFVVSKVSVSLKEVVSVIFLAVLMNSAVWGPILLEMCRATSQEYRVEHQLSAIHPVDFAGKMLSRLLPLEYLEKIAGKWPSFKHPCDFLLGLDGQGLLFLGYGWWQAFRRPGGRVEHFWLPGLLGFSFGYFFLRDKLPVGIRRGIDILKMVKCQELMAFPFIIQYLLTGIQDYFDSPHSSTRGRLVSLLVATQALTIVWRLGKDSCTPYEPTEISTRGFARTRFGLVPQVLFPRLRRHIGCELRGGERALHLLANLLSGCFFLVRKQALGAGPGRNILEYAAFALALGPFGKMGYSRFGGWPCRQEIFAQDYYASQENEKLAREYVSKAQGQYRVLYSDHLETLQRRFPDDARFFQPSVPEENRDSPFPYHTRKYIFHAAAQGLSIPDGFVQFPGKSKKAFFAGRPQLFQPFPGMYELAWNACDPFDPDVASELNVKYVISRYPLPGLELLNTSKEYWSYLYHLPEALPICRGVLEPHFTQNDPDTIVKKWWFGKDRILIEVDSARGGWVRVNMTLDQRWRVWINGIERGWELIDGVFPRLRVPPGHSRVSGHYSYSPFYAFLGLSGVAGAGAWRMLR
jgi:hypothetical protein